MWITIYIQTLSPITDVILYTVSSVFVTILIIVAFIYGPKEWEKNKKALKPYNDALAINSNDITALNNKGVELTNQKKPDKAMECFDRILEIDPGDAAAWNNKSALLNRQRRYTQARIDQGKALELDPGLENARKSGKLILEVKMKKPRISILKS